MQVIKCISHENEFSLPIDESEYCLKDSHTKIELFVQHIEKFHNCKFKEVEKS
jgi:hypothetical protein